MGQVEGKIAIVTGGVRQELVRLVRLHCRVKAPRSSSPTSTMPARRRWWVRSSPPEAKRSAYIRM